MPQTQGLAANGKGREQDARIGEEEDDVELKGVGDSRADFDRHARVFEEQNQTQIELRHFSDRFSNCKMMSRCRKWRETARNLAKIYFRLFAGEYVRRLTNMIDRSDNTR